MSVLAELEVVQDVVEETDRLGGGFSTLESDVYDLTVVAAYVTKSQGGAMALNLQLTGANKELVKESLYMTSGTAKGGKNYYVSKKDGTKHYLPGFNQANAVSLLITGKEISALTTEKKHLNLYDFLAKKEVATEVDSITELIGGKLKVGLLKKTVDIRQKNDTTGKYEPSGKTKEVNEIDKIFRPSDGMTVMEIKAQLPAAVFMPKWVEKWKGQVKDETTKTGVTAGAPSAAVNTPPVKNLFAQ